MLTLIKREIYDNMVYFIAALILSLMMIVILISISLIIDAKEMPNFTVVCLAPVIIIFLLGLTGMGVSQMYTDRNRRISAYLSTLAVTRVQIFIARIGAGILAILLFIVPQIITTSILYKLFMPSIQTFESIFFDIYTVAFLAALSFYCIGLQTGWTSSRLIPALGALPYVCIFATLIIVKGIGMQTLLLLILFIAASLIRIRQNFISTPL